MLTNDQKLQLRCLYKRWTEASKASTRLGICAEAMRYLAFDCALGSEREAHVRAWEKRKAGDVPQMRLKF